MSTSILREADLRARRVIKSQAAHPARCEIAHPDEIKIRSVLIQPGTQLPAAMSPSLKRIGEWNLVSGLDSFAISRALIKENWHFSFVVPAIKKGALRRTRHKAVRAALRKLVRELTINKFNAVEITGIVTRRFLGLYWVQLTGHASHIAANPFVNDRQGLSQRPSRVNFDPHFEILEIANAPRRLRSVMERRRQGALQPPGR